MKNTILLFLTCLFLTSCYTQKKAIKEIIKADITFPNTTASFCAGRFPLQEKITEKITYKKGKDSIVYDTISVDCKKAISNGNATQKVAIKTIYKTDTIYKYKETKVENTAKLKDCENRVANCANELYALQPKYKALDAAYKTEKALHSKWKLYFFLLLGAGIAYHAIKLYLKVKP